MNKRVINIYKPVSITPLQLINLYKETYPKYKNKKIAYAGRLDPLAHGVLILLIEPETKNAKKYQNLDKEYEFEVLFGVETDSFDILGRVTHKIPRKERILRQTQDDHVKRGKQHSMKRLPALSNNMIKRVIKTFIGKRKQKYPPFSSKTVKGKPLFWWAREGRLKDIKLPSKNIEVYSIDFIKSYEIKINKLRNEVIKKIKSVKGNFRQKAIMKEWEKFFLNLKSEGKRDSSTPLRMTNRAGAKQKQFIVAKYKIHCSSGTYVRQITHEMGQMLGCGAIALDILRIRVGEYKLEKSLHL